MPAYIIYDNDGNIKRWGCASAANIELQRREGLNLSHIDYMEKGLDKKYKVNMDKNKNTNRKKNGNAKLKKKD